MAFNSLTRSIDSPFNHLPRARRPQGVDGVATVSSRVGEARKRSRYCRSYVVDRSNR